MLHPATESFALAATAYSEKISHEGALARSKLNQVRMVGLTHLMRQPNPPSASRHSLA
jgi:hypothetical protein